MKVFKIALTGGPCAGKSTMYDKIQKKLKEENYKVLLVDETAKQLILRGIIPNDDNYESLKRFQNIVYYYQKMQERCAYDAIYYNQDKEICIILCDRGLLDNKAYLNDYKDFDDIVKNNNDDEIQILDSYDLVLDLTSLAITKPDFYGKNNFRFESPELATFLDSKTKMAWVGHHNLKTINTEDDIEAEFNKIMFIIYDLINQNKYKEKDIEYDVDSIDINKYNDNNSRNIIIKEQGLIDKYNDTIYKVYFRTYKEKTSIVLSINDGNTRKITRDEYIYLIKNTNVIYNIEYEELHFVEFNQIYRLRNINNEIKLYIKEKDKQLIPQNIIIKNKEKTLKREKNCKNSNLC